VTARAPITDDQIRDYAARHPEHADQCAAALLLDPAGRALAPRARAWVARAIRAEQPRKRRGARPLNGAGPAARLHLKAPAETIATYSAAAERKGLTLSAWVREACDLAVARGSSR
jgi:hypothetical protein